MIVFQSPNKPALIVLVAAVAHLFLTGQSYGWVVAIFYLFAGIWAYLEITSGVNNFRKIIGAIVMILVITSLGSQLVG